MMVPAVDQARSHVDAVRAKAAEIGREIGVFTRADITCLPTQKEAAEYYGPPERIRQVTEAAAVLGLPTRRTGPSVSVLRAEELREDDAETLREASGSAPLRRPASLEDVFVLLTGEVIG